MGRRTDETAPPESFLGRVIGRRARSSFSGIGDNDNSVLNREQTVGLRAQASRIVDPGRLFIQRVQNQLDTGRLKTRFHHLRSVVCLRGTSRNSGALGVS